MATTTYKDRHVRSNKYWIEMGHVFPWRNGGATAVCSCNALSALVGWLLPAVEAPGWTLEGWKERMTTDDCDCDCDCDCFFCLTSSAFGMPAAGTTVDDKVRCTLSCASCATHVPSHRLMLGDDRRHKPQVQTSVTWQLLFVIFLLVYFVLFLSACPL